jgi:hypothetical protein
MIETAKKVQWVEGHKVIVCLPYERKAIGTIKKVTGNSIHVMYGGREVVYGVDGKDISFSANSTYHTSIKVPENGELKKVITNNRRDKLSHVDFYSLTDEQVNAIFIEMKCLGVDI